MILLMHFHKWHKKKRYKDILFAVDTCQANTLYKQFYSPNILAIGSSKLGENSYSHHSDADVGVSVIDRFTYYTLEYMEKVTPASNLSIMDLFSSYSVEKIHSHSEWRADLYRRNLDETLITDFFGSVFTYVPIVNYSYPISQQGTKYATVEKPQQTKETTLPKKQPVVLTNYWNPEFVVGSGVLVIFLGISLSVLK